MIELLPVNESDSRCSIVQSNNGLVYPGMILASFRTHDVSWTNEAVPHLYSGTYC